GDTPVPGDWDGDRVTTVGVYEPAAAVWKLRNSNSPGAPDLAPFAYGSPDGLSQPARSPYGPVGLLQAAVGPPRGDAAAAPLTPADRQQTVTAALTRLHAAGVSTTLLDRLEQAQFSVTTLAPGGLGTAFPSLNRVLLDATAAGHGWFVDPTPLQDE